ncbi:MAG: hypothetical protein ACKO6N_07685 [Myxococcota bacterium]
MADESNPQPPLGEKPPIIPAKPVFGRTIRTLQDGRPLVPVPSASGERYQLARGARPLVMLFLLLVVSGTVLVLDYLASQERVREAERAAIKAAQAPTPTPAPPQPEPAGPIFVQAYQYHDAADTRPPEADKDTLLESGDYLTLVSRGRQRKWLYYIVMGSNDQMRISRIYTPELAIRHIPPLKITVRDKQAGKIQALVVGLRDETPEINNWMWEQNYKSYERSARQQRLEGFLARLQKEVPADKWAYKLLPELDYRP